MGENMDSIILWENAVVENLFFFCDSQFNRALDFFTICAVTGSRVTVGLPSLQILNPQLNMALSKPM